MENTSTPRADSPALAPAALNQDALISRIRAIGREELVHYAGAAHRDPIAWQMCLAAISDPNASEAVLKSRAVKAAWGWDVAPEQFEAAGSRTVRS